MKINKYSLGLSALGLMFVAGCQANDNEPVDEAGANNLQNEENNTTNNDNNTNDGETEELTFWHIATGGAEEALEKAVERFEADHNAEVEMIRHDNDPYKTNLSVAMGGGEPPDVFHSWGGGYLKEYVDAGQVMNITDEIDRDHFLEVGMSMTTFDDEVYGAPLAMSLVPVYYNKEIFDDLGLEEPETYSELLDIIETLKDNDVIPFALANQTRWPGAFYLMYFAERIGGLDLFTDAFSREGSFDDEAYVEAGRKIQELVEMDAFPDGVNAMAYDVGQSRQLIYSEQAAMIIQTTNFIRDARNEAEEFADKLDFFLFPDVEGGKGSRTNLVGGLSPAFSVAENSDNKELAVELIHYLTDIETAQEVSDAAQVVSAVANVQYEDDLVVALEEALWDSDGLQGFYDQTLPPQLATVHLETTQALFGLEMTPEEAAQEMEEAAQDILD